MNPIRTVGHSNHSFAVFLGLLRRAGVDTVVDVRSRPASRFVPHFNGKALAAALAGNGIGYLWLKELGGMSGSARAKGVRPDFAARAKEPEFREGLERVLELARTRRIALMCAERDPLNCHRFHLVARELAKLRPAPEIAHILADGTIEPHAAARARLEPRAPDLFNRERT